LRKILGIIGFLLLVIAVILYLYLNTHILGEVFDGKTPWFHSHIVEYARQGLDLRNDKYLWLFQGRDLYRSPILLDLLIVSINYTSQLGYITLAMAVLIAIITYILTYIVFKQHIASGLASFIALFTPATIYWFKGTMYGPYILAPLGILSLIILSKGLRGGNSSLILSAIGGFLIGLIWHLWSSSWILLLVYSSYMLALIYHGRVTKNSLLASIIILAITIPFNIILGLKYILLYHILGYYSLLSATLIALLEYRLVPESYISVKRNIWRIIGLAASISLTLTLTFLIISLIELPGLYEAYAKPYKPLDDLFSLVLLAPFALVLYLRAGYASKPYEKPLEFLLASGFIIASIAGFFDPPLAVFAIILVAPIIAFALERIAVFIIKNTKGLPRILFTIAVLWIMIASILGNFYTGYRDLSRGSIIYYDGIPKELAEKPVVESSILKVLDSVEGENAIVISYWGKSYWIVDYTRTHVIADDDGPFSDWKIISAILVSDEELSLGLINKTILSRYPNYKVYILVTEAVTIEKQLFGENTTYAHIGRPYITGEETPTARYMPVDDIGRFTQYLLLAGENPINYIDLTKQQIKYRFEIPLAWNDKAKNTLLIKLVIDALRKQGYQVVNDIVSPAPILSGDVEPPKYFKLVKASITYLYSETTDIYEFKVYYMAALYELDMG